MTSLSNPGHLRKKPSEASLIVRLTEAVQWFGMTHRFGNGGHGASIIEVSMFFAMRI